MTDTEIKAALTDKMALAITMQREAVGDSSDGSSVEERIAVGCVVRNRIGRYGRTYREVCLRPNQFSCWIPEGGAENYAKTMALARQLLMLEPAVEAASPLFTETACLAEGIMSGRILDRSHGATHYVTVALLRNHSPKWAALMKATCIVGTQAFFREGAAA